MPDSILPKITVVGNTWQISGDVRVENAHVMFSESAALGISAPINIDFSHVTNVDTTALSLMIQWQRLAVRAGASVTFSSVPDNLISLAALYGVTEFLPLQVQ